MRLPDRRERAWLITGDPSGEGFTVLTFGSESELLSSVSSRLRTRISSTLAVGSTSVGGGYAQSAWEGSWEGEARDRAILPFAMSAVDAPHALEHGRQLWSALPPEAVASLSGGDDPGPPLVVKIVTEGSGFGRLPWEWLADERGEHLALRPGVRLVRTVPAQLPVPPVSVKPPLHVLVVGAIRGDERSLDPAMETDTVRSALKGRGFRVDVLERASRAMLLEAIARRAPHVIHHIGFAATVHGEGSLALVAKNGSTEWMTTAELAGSLPPTTRLLCLSIPSGLGAYRSLGAARIAEAPSVAGLPTTILSRYPVAPDEATTFWGVFYPALVEKGGDVIEASQAARAATADAHPGSAAWASFTPVVRDQTGVSFEFARRKAVSARRRNAEIAAQFAAKIANDLGAQMSVFGDSASAALREQFETEHERASTLSSRLDDEAL